MKNELSILHVTILRLSIIFLSANAFQTTFFPTKSIITSTKQCTTILSLAAATKPVSAVSVCTAELCQCQEESGQDILDDLLSRNLPYSVDEAPCLGACGGWAMVAIDFEDRSSALVAGLEETLLELGIKEDGIEVPVVKEDTAVTASIEDDMNENQLEVKSISTKTTVLASPEETNIQEPITSTTETETTSISDNSTKEELSEDLKKTKDFEKKYEDARDRMRAQAAKARKENEETINPWLNAASYLAKKAGEQLFKT